MYKERRSRLLEALPEYSLSVLYSGEAPYAIGDEKYPFKVDRSFYYYTGLDRENMTLVLVKLPGGCSETLFIEPFDPQMAKWVGGKLLPKEAEEISGVEDVRFVESLKQYISTIINRYGSTHEFRLYGDLNRQQLTQPLPVVDLLNELKSAHPDVTICNLFEHTTRMRMVKSEEEIALMKQAIEITRQGIEAMMINSRPFVSENEMEAYFDFVLKSENCEHAFSTIAASGKNATILHYGQNNCRSKENDMLLVDLGAAYKYYNADISRTFPLSGKFTERQKQIYDIVLRCNKMIIDEAKPGDTTRTLNVKVIAFYQKELKEIGLLENGKKVSDYYWHGVSHHLGLETHDVTLFDEPLVPGCVITDEPGLYLEDEGIGIRIEDDILITEDGCEVLSKDIIKEIDDIENFMKRN